MTVEQPPQSSDTELAGVVERNIATLIERRRAEERSRSSHERIIQAISRFTGRMRFLYLNLAVFGMWIAINAGLLPVPRFDRSFGLLATVASIEAILLSTIVLISQNRMSVLADKRADLDLQISLLTEHEMTRVITLLSEVAERMGIPSASDPELAELAREVEPGRVLDSLEESEAAAARAETTERAER